MLDQIVATREQLPVKESTDSRTIAACQQGDREALRVLFEEYKDRVYSIAIYSLSGDEMAAADVTQQVFLKLMTRIGQFRGNSEFATWLYRLVVNTCHDEHRKQKRFEVVRQTSRLVSRHQNQRDKTCMTANAPPRADFRAPPARRENMQNFMM